MKHVRDGRTSPVICLDAGHYGKYNRSPVEPDLYESEFNWKLQRYLTEELQKLGMQVKTTKKDIMEDPELVKRGEMARDCDLFLSLHANSATNREVNYVLGIYFVDDECSQIDDYSRELAQILSDAVAQHMGVKSTTRNRQSAKDRDGNGYPDDYYGVLRGAHSVKTPGVILEHGFYTNPAQAKFLLDDQNVRNLAELEAKVLEKWFDMGRDIVGNPCTVNLHSLKMGCRGEAVESLQALLIWKGYSCGETGIDGSFGPMTDKAVRLYQSDMELEVDGSAGPITLRALMGYV